MNHHLLFNASKIILRFLGQKLLLSTVENTLSLYFEIGLQISTRSLWKLYFLSFLFLKPGIELTLVCGIWKNFVLRETLIES